MQRIYLETRIAAPIGDVFDLARDIDAHIASTPGTNERAIAGRTSGRIELGETVTWEARHLGLRWRLRTRITRLDFPRVFVDEAERGPFQRMRHEHRFESVGEATRMLDEFTFSLPWYFGGTLAERWIALPHLRAFLIRRNAALKGMAETED